MTWLVLGLRLDLFLVLMLDFRFMFIVRVFDRCFIHSYILALGLDLLVLFFLSPH